MPPDPASLRVGSPDQWRRVCWTFRKPSDYMLKKLIFPRISVRIAVFKIVVSPMQVKERLIIKEIQDLPPEDVMNVYELVLDLKKQKSVPQTGTPSPLDRLQGTS
jgi:hypothetical protein